MKEAEKRLKKYQEIFDKLSIKLDEFKDLKVALENLSNQFEDLERYYQKYWLSDVEKSDEINLAITSQDTIWSLLEEKDELFDSLSEVLKSKNED